jgi:hypothetical protein
MEYCRGGDVFHALLEGRVWRGVRPALDDVSVVPPPLCLRIATDIARGMV